MNNSNVNIRFKCNTTVFCVVIRNLQTISSLKNYITEYYKSKFKNVTDIDIDIRNLKEV